MQSDFTSPLNNCFNKLFLYDGNKTCLKDCKENLTIIKDNIALGSSYRIYLIQKQYFPRHSIMLTHLYNILCTVVKMTIFR